MFSATMSLTMSSKLGKPLQQIPLDRSFRLKFRLEPLLQLDDTVKAQTPKILFGDRESKFSNYQNQRRPIISSNAGKFKDIVL